MSLNEQNTNRNEETKERSHSTNKTDCIGYKQKRLH